jgi:ATP-dependent exoDNAse (exonuclease V) beta subunit
MYLGSTPGVGYLPTQHSNPVDDARLLYVGMTRSTHHLVMSYHQASDFVQRLNVATRSHKLSDSN